MSKASNINSLAALRERRREIATEQEAARQGLTSTLAEAPAKAKDYALEDLALPALGVGLAVYVGYRVLRSRKSEDHVREDAPVYQQALSAPAPGPVRQVAHPVPEPRSRPALPPPREEEQDGSSSSFSLSTLLAAGKLLIPAAQAIYSAVQKQRMPNAATPSSGEAPEIEAE